MDNNDSMLFKLARQFNTRVRNDNTKFQTFMFYISQYMLILNIL